MKTKLGVSLLALIAIVPRFLFLGLRPFEGDEGIVIKIAQSPNFPALIKAVASDVHPPVFHVLEFVALKIFPLTEFSARLVSAFAGAAAIYFIYLSFCKFTSSKNALMVSLLSSINPILSYHFAEVRPYALLTLLVFAQLYFFLKIKEHHSAKKESTSDLLWFVILSTLMALTQYISFAIFIGQILYLLICEGKINYKKVLAGFISLAIFAGLWGKIFISQLSGRMAEQSQSLDLKANIIGLFNALYRFLAGRLFLDLDPSPGKNLAFLNDNPIRFLIFSITIIVPITLFIWGLVVLYNKKRENFWLIAIVFAPVVLGAIISSEIGPRAVRYLLFLAPFAVYVLLESTKLHPTRFKNVLFTIFLLIYVASFINGLFYERKKPGVNKIAQSISEQAPVGDNILVAGGFGGGEALILDYYLKEKAKDYNINDLYGDYQVGNLDELKARQPIEKIIELKKLSPSKNVWFYDFTYTFDEKNNALSFTKINLGKDKEGKELILYKF